MNKDNKQLAKWIVLFVFIALLIVLYKTLDNFGAVKDSFNNFIKVISPFPIGVLIAYLLYMPCRNLEEIFNRSKAKFVKNKSRVLSIFAVYILVIFIITLFFRFVIPILYENIVELINNVPTYYGYIIDEINNIPEDSVLNDFGIIEGANDFFNKYLKDAIDLEHVLQYAKNMLAVMTNLFKTIISIIVSIYLLIERKSIFDFLDRLSSSLFEKKKHENIKRYFQKINEIFFTFIGSKVLDSIINGMVVTILLLLFNVKYAILLGIMAGVFNLVPYFGSIVACSLIALITIFTGGIGKALTLLVVLIIFQQMDANIIEPRIMRSSLKISPILVIFSVMVGGAYFGVVGMFLGVPIITALKMILLDWVSARQRLINN